MTTAFGYGILYVLHEKYNTYNTYNAVDAAWCLCKNRMEVLPCSRSTRCQREPLYEQIIQQVQQFILTDVLQPGGQIPSVRSVSMTNSINPRTLLKAYTELDAKGLIQSVPGKGYYVCADAKQKLLEKGREKMKDLTEMLTALAMAGVTKEGDHRLCGTGVYCCKGTAEGRRMSMIEVKNLTKRFHDFTALEDVSCSIGSGCIYGMVGSNGAGKSTFLRALTGVYQPDAGKILIDGQPVWDNPAVKRRIAYVPDELYFLAGANLNRMERMYQSLYPDFDKNRFEKLCGHLQLPRNKSLGQFSKGMRRQAATILALSCRPDYLFFDETFDGLDPVMRSFVKKLICEDVLERGASAIITSHSLRELEDICDQLALLHKGGLVLESDIENLKTSQFKIQIAFREDYDKSKFDGIQISHYEKSGSVANLIVSGEREDIVQKLRAMDPILLDVLPLSLEEVFTYEMETLGYTFQIDDLIEEENRHAES